MPLTCFKKLEPKWLRTIVDSVFDRIRYRSSGGPEEGAVMVRKLGCEIAQSTDNGFKQIRDLRRFRISRPKLRSMSTRDNKNPGNSTWSLPASAIVFRKTERGNKIGKRNVVGRHLCYRAIEFVWLGCGIVSKWHWLRGFHLEVSGKNGEINVHLLSQSFYALTNINRRCY